MTRTWNLTRLLPEADKGATSGPPPDAEDTPPAPAPTPQAAETLTPAALAQVEQSFQRALERRNQDGVALAREMFEDNYQLRRKNKALSDEVRDLQAKAPAPDAVMLSAAEAAAWAAYQALGTPAAIQQGLDARAQLQQQVEAQAREATLRTVAAAAGYKLAVLTHLDRMAQAQGKALAFAVRDTDVDGQPTPTAFVQDGEQEQPLAAYAAQHWADFLPALAVPTGAPPPPGVRYPAQHPGGRGEPVTTKSMADAALNKAYGPRKPAA